MTDTLQCYICFESETPSNIFAKDPKPCICKGSIEIHEKCLQNVVKNSHNCSICKSRYNLKYLPTKDGKELIIEASNDGGVIEYTVDEQGEKHGSYIIRNRYGQMIILHSYIHGIMEGPYVEYYNNGQIRLVCKCKNNRIDGEYSEWYEDGTILEESHYKNGRKHGDCTNWVREGYMRIASVTKYEDGEPIDEDGYA